MTVAAGESVEFAPQASVCGALGCRETDALVRVDRGPRERVLCPECARRGSQ